MTPHIQPASVSLEFLTWITAWIAFRILQRRLCRRYPGLRTVCRTIFLLTLVVAVAPGVCTIVFHSVPGPRLVALLNHVFGLGVLAQTLLRSLLLMPWLRWPATEYAAPEACAIATLLALTQILRHPDHSRPVEPDAPPTL